MQGLSAEKHKTFSVFMRLLGGVFALFIWVNSVAAETAETPAAKPSELVKTHPYMEPAAKADMSVLKKASSNSTNKEDPASMSEAEKRQKVHELYQKQIPLLEQYAEKYPTGPRAAQTMFRLGEAYFETAKYYGQLEQQSRVSLYVQKATAILEKLRQLHPYYERIDEALLVLASTYLENGDQGKAGPILAEIADRFPKSPIMDQAAFLLGDYYYERGRFPQAREFYLKAADREKTKAYAHYKLAWVAIKESQPALALKNFEMVIQTGTAEGKSFDYSNDAAREMVWPAFEVHRAAGVVAYLEKTVKDKALFQKSLESLAIGLESKDEFKLASQIYDELIKRFPSDPKNSEWLLSQLKIEEKLGRSDRVGVLLSKLSQSGARSSEELQAMIYSNAKKFHGMAQQEKEPTRKGQLYDQALAYYVAFNSLGLANAKAAETQFYYGEALYARGRYDEAMNAYRTASETSNDKQTDALWAWYLTAEKRAPAFSYKGKDKISLEAKDEQFLEIAKRVAETESLGMEKRRTASYQSARLVYQANDYERALPIFKALAERYPGTKEGELSAQLVLDIYNLRNDYTAVAKFARDYQGSASGTVKSEFQGVEQKAAFKAIQEAEATAKGAPESTRGGELKDVAKKYLEFARLYPASPLVDAGVWAAVQMYATAADLQKDKEYEELRASFQTLIRDYPKSKYRAEAVKLMGEFLADHQADESMLAVYQEFRPQWMQLMRAQPASSRGTMGMLVYKMSSDSQKAALENEFAQLPFTPENRVALAYGKRGQLLDLKEQFTSVTLGAGKNLGPSTKKKIALLEKLEGTVTKFVELGVASLSVEALEILALAQANMAYSLREAPEPKSLQGEDLVSYRAAVDNKAKEFDQKAERTRQLKEKARTQAGG